jgi:hypothetical protein
MNAISTALAARYAAGQVTPPAGMGNIRYAGNPLNAMAPTPCVFVFYDASAFDKSAGNASRFGVHSFIVRFYFQQSGDILRDNVALQKWATVLNDQLKTGMQLGGTVSETVVDAAKIGYMSYANKDYSGIEQTVHVVTTEGWAAVA